MTITEQEIAKNQVYYIVNKLKDKVFHTLEMKKQRWQHRQQQQQSQRYLRGQGDF